MNESTTKQQVESRTQNRSTKILIISAILFLLFIVISALIYIFYFQKGTNNQEEQETTESADNGNVINNNNESESNTEVTKETTSSAEINDTFDAFGIFTYGKKYLEDLDRYYKDNTINFSCSEHYNRVDGEDYSSYSEGEKHLLEDSFLVNFLSKTNENLPIVTDPNTGSRKERISSIRKCTTDDNKILIVFRIDGGAGGGLNRVIFGYVTADYEMNPVIEIPNEGVVYFGCTNPLLLTNNNILYYECGGGDGFSSQSSVYKIDLIKGSYQRIYSCRSSSSIENPEVLSTNCFIP